MRADRELIYVRSHALGSLTFLIVNAFQDCFSCWLFSKEKFCIYPPEPSAFARDTAYLIITAIDRQHLASHACYQEMFKECCPVRSGSRSSVYP